MARIELSNIGGGGTTLSLTTTGTSGAATLVGSTLNIPIYQGALTLTTTGTSGAATLVGNTLNIPNYATGGTPAGAAGQVQFNSTPAGSFAASANLAWDNTATQLNIGAPSSPTGKLNVKGSGASSSTVNLRLTNSGNTELLKVLDNGDLSAVKLSLGFPVGTGTYDSYGFVSSSNNMHLTSNAYYDGANWRSYASSATRGSAISFQTNGLNNRALSIGVDNNISAANEILSFDSLFSVETNGNTFVYSSSTPLTASARLHVRGSNTSSGTNAFLVQNSTPSDLYKIENNGKISYWATNTAAGTTGAQTIDRPSGTVNFGIGASALVVTNALCTTSSIVFATVRTNDATAYIKNVVPAAGSFTINLGAAATAETSVGFFIIN